MRKKILVITAYQPNDKNEGGGPTGLIWEVVYYLIHTLHFQVEQKITPLPSGKIAKMLQRNGFYLTNFESFNDKYDAILVYPEQLFFRLNKTDRRKAIILGPDCPSFRDARVYRTKRNLFPKFIKAIMIFISRYHEYVALKYVKKYIVVGKTDSKYMKSNVLISKRKDMKDKIIFLRHPIIRGVINTKYINHEGEKRFIFAITPKNENEVFISRMIKELQCSEQKRHNALHVVLVGKSSFWMKEMFCSLKNTRVEYFDWIENYKELCLYSRDVHCLPLLSGSGTKNRTLTALGNGLLVISTPIGIENIPRHNEVGVFITSRPDVFAEYMMNINDGRIKVNQEELAKSRLHLINEISNEFTNTMNSIFMEE